METKEKERVLVCISPSPSNKKVIRIASRLAVSLHGDLFAIYVDDGYSGKKTGENNYRCMENIQYAQSLGARLVVSSGKDVAGEIVRYAKRAGITRIVIGKSVPPRRWMILRRNIAQRLGDELPHTEIVSIPKSAPSFDPQKIEKKPIVTLRDAGVSVGLLGLATLLCWWFHLLGFTDATLITVYILAVLIISFLTNGHFCGGVSSLLGVLVFNFLFTVPRFSLKSYGTGYPVTLVVMFFAAFLTSSLTSQVKRQAQQHAQNAYRTEVLLHSNRRLQLAANEDEILREAAGQLQKLLLRSVVLYPIKEGEIQAPIAFPVGESEEELLHSAADLQERRVVQWVMENNTQAGAGTGIYDDASFWYLTVRVNDCDMGCAIVGIRIGKGESIDPFDKNLLLAMLGECAVALEKYRLDRSKSEYVFRARQEQLRSDLLRSISHDLRTPLTSISGSANMLMNGSVESSEDRMQLYTDIYDDSIWLIGLVENLLSVTKMDDGRLRLHLQPQDVSDILEATGAHVQSRKKGHRLNILYNKELMIVNVDISLVVQLLVNLIDNAFKYAGEQGTVTVSAQRQGHSVVFYVADDGPGIADSEKEKVFEMFYTMQGQASIDGRRGLGLGLSLCKSIAQAHGGTICVKDNVPHGAVFALTLPILEAANEQ